MKRLARKDVTGQRLKVGDIVRVVGVPDLSGMAVECQAESLPVFKHLVGKYKRIREFDEYGHAGLWFRILKGPHAGIHWVALEPYFLRRRRSERS